MILKKSSILKVTTASAVAFLLNACGDDVMQVNNGPLISVLDESEKLEDQKCSSENEGDILFVKDSLATFFCDGENWMPMKGANGKNGGNGKNGEDGTSCSAKKVSKGDRSGVELACDGIVIDTVWNGVDGKNGKSGGNGNNGIGCEMKPAEATAEHKNGGYKIVCGDDVFSLWNGNNGEDGTLGSKGVDDQCTASKLDATADHKNGGVEVTCGEEKFQLWNGNDGLNGSNGNSGTSCTAAKVTKDGRNGVELSCDGKVVSTIWNGTDGESGKSGASCNGKAVTKDGRKGIELTCDGKVVSTIWDGTDGKPGDNGSDCTAKTVKNDDRAGIELTCSGKVVGTIWNGIDGKSGNDGSGCSIESEKDGVVTMKCGKQTVYMYSAVCGVTTYDVKKAYCFEGELYSCNDKPYNPNREYCNENEIKSLKVCTNVRYGDITLMYYNPEINVCYRDGSEYAMVKPRYTSCLEDEDVLNWNYGAFTEVIDGFESNEDIFDAAQYFCYVDYSEGKFAIAEKCGGEDYYLKDQFCYDNGVYDKCGEYRDMNYNDDYGVFNPEEKVCQDFDIVNALCGNDAYNPTKQICTENEKVVDAVCGDEKVAYNPLLEMCALGDILSKRSDLR